MATVGGRGINAFLVRLAILVMAVALLAIVLFFKASSTGGFNPISALPVVSPSALPADLRSRLDCPESRSRLRSFDLNRDGEVEYFLECLGEPTAPPTITVLAHRNGAWETLAAGEILGILQTQTNGYYDLLQHIPPDPAHGRFWDQNTQLRWQGRAYKMQRDAR